MHSDCRKTKMISFSCGRPNGIVVLIGPNSSDGFRHGSTSPERSQDFSRTLPRRLNFSQTRVTGLLSRLTGLHLNDSEQNYCTIPSANKIADCGCRTIECWIIAEILKREDAQRAVQEFCKAHNTKLCVVYGSQIVQGTVTRDLAVYNQADEKTALEIVAALTSNKEPDLDLQPQPCSVEGFMLFDQCNIKATRKQILPIIRQVGEKISVEN
ncbi:hypothetical protein J6590_077106 [Homalodisca vitripennis]|nr:hypothetical protein J6590_077106 [Homalodisca vitripennis]